MLKTEQPLKRNDEETPIAIVATMEQEQSTNKEIMNKHQNWGCSRASPEGCQKTEVKNP